MADKIVQFNKSVLEEYLNNPSRSEYIDNMADMYRNIRDHLKVCEKISEDVFGPEYSPDSVIMIHNISMDFMSGECDNSPAIEFEPDDRLTRGEEEI